MTAARHRISDAATRSLAAAVLLLAFGAAASAIAGTPPVASEGRPPAAAQAPLAAAAPPELSPAVADAFTLLDLWIAEHIAYHGWPGLALGVVYQGELIWSRGYGVSDLATRTPVTPQTRFRLGSASKLFTATAVLQLRDAGRLDLDDPVTRHLPGFAVHSPFPDALPVTLRHVLTHTAGLPREGDFPYWTTHDFPTAAEVLAVARNQSLLHPPGERYGYSNLGIALLGQVVAAVSGQPWARYVDEQILVPLGMTRSAADPTLAQRRGMASGYMRRLPDGSRRAHDYYPTRGLAPAAAVTSTVEDLARFAALHLRDEPQEERPEPVLAGHTVREMRRPQVVHEGWNGGRGLGFGILRVEGETLVTHGGWIGGHRSHLLLDPDAELAVVAMTNADDMSPWFFSRRAWELAAGALAETPDAERPKPDPAWQRYLGLYSDPWGWEYRVLLLGGELVVYEHDYPPAAEPTAGVSRLRPRPDGSFLMPDGEPLAFEIGPDGRVERIRRRSEYLYPVPRPAGGTP
ncbi:MAG TPA: serine hydrolase domain-containing protein [Thermoanaerobaculia bacterium]|nr:serine hydrolase domain-containing protein [Thermoanaerobaculia bacterium]